jgi:hypothetical protein
MSDDNTIGYAAVAEAMQIGREQTATLRRVLAERAADHQRTRRHPPKKNLMEAIKLIEREIEQCSKRAVAHQSYADNPPRPDVDTAYWQRAAIAATKKARRLGLVTEWLERSYIE